MSDSAAEQQRAISNVTVIDGNGGPPLARGTVIVSGGRITAVGPAADVPVPPSAEVVDGSGRFLIPGLWEMHAHLSKIRGSALSLFLANGVTTVRDMGGELPEVRAWQDEIRRGDRLGPRVITAGPYLEAATNVLRARLEGQIEPTERVRVGVANPEVARRVVDSIAALGVDFLKIRTFENRETYRAIAAAARRNGLTLVGHPFGASIADLVAARHASIEHFLPLGDRPADERQDVYRQLVDSNMVVVPELTTWHHSLFVVDSIAARVVYDTAGVVEPKRRYVSAFLAADWEEQLPERNPETVNEWRTFYDTVIRDLREMHAAGVRILAGADVAVVLIFPGFSLHDELELFVTEIGMTPMEALQSATRWSAEFMERSDSVGTIEAGRAADFVLLDANPLDDIRNTRRIAGVVAAGQYYDRAALDDVLEAVTRMPDVREIDWVSEDRLPDSLRRAYATLQASRSAEDVAGAVRVLETMPDPHGAVAAFLETRINSAGYRLMRRDLLDDAIVVFRFNTERYPLSGNVWDSLGESLLAAGDTSAAVASYERSLELDPANGNATRILHALGRRN